MLLNKIEDMDEEIYNFFTKIGFDVTWDKQGSKYWYEISLGDKLIQIDFGVPLSVILNDLKCDYQNIPQEDSGYEYIISGPESHFKAIIDHLFKNYAI